MSETALTRGPWELREADGNYLFQVVGKTARGKDEVICRPAGKNRKANGHLLAAALELLELTRLLERTLVYEIKKSKAAGDDEGANLKSFTLAEVRGALARAEGRS